MLSETSKVFRLAVVAVVTLIATSVASLAVVLSHEDTAMAQGTSWPSKPAATPSSTPSSSGVAATPSTTPTTAPTTAQTSPVAENSPVASDRTKTRTTRGPITYTVKRGDNLTVIADWFKLRGYGDLYEKNRKTIGADPDLIRPGQKITVSSAGMTTNG